MTTRSTLARRCANTISVLSVVAIVVTLAGRLVWSTATPEPDGIEAPDGKRLHIAGVDFASNGRTLVVAVSSHCADCVAEKNLFVDLTAANPHVIGIVPPEIAADDGFLQSVGLTGAVVRTAKLSELGIPQTPALLVVDSGARVTAHWFGQMGPQEELAVRVRLGAEPRVRPILPEEAAFTQKASHAAILDTRERLMYEASHVRGAVNIPVDELMARAVHELAKTTPVIVLCGGGSACTVGVETECPNVSTRLLRLGFQDVRLLAADKVSLLGSGLSFVDNHQ